MTTVAEIGKTNETGVRSVLLFGFSAELFSEFNHTSTNYKQNHLLRKLDLS